jgi:hypothetical protein
MQQKHFAAMAHRLSMAAAFILVSISCFQSRATACVQNGVTPAPGDIAVSEVMFNPALPADDNDGEYFEVTNISGKILDFGNLYIQDLETPGSASAPYVKIPAGALPDLYPGQSFVFARSGDPVLNGGLPKVDYVYSVPVGGITPADKSKVSHTAMSFSNSSIDAVAVTRDAPQNVGGTVIEMITYDPTKAPLNVNNGVGFERANLLAPWAIGNIAASTMNFGPIPQFGTPGMANSNDSTLYPCYYKYQPAQPGPADTGVLVASGPASVHSGIARLLLKNGPPNQLFAFAVAAAPAEIPMFGGTALVDLFQADLWSLDSYIINSNGTSTLDIQIAPALLGMQFHVQWFSYDAASAGFVFSNGLGVDIVN